MVFKKRNLYVLDISDLDAEKLHSKRNGLGVPDYRCVVETPHGVVWCNKGGVYLYDGEFQFLLEEEGVDKISIQTWQDLTGFDSGNIANITPDIGYSQENDKILICTDTASGNTTSGDLLAYHFRTKAWYIGRDVFPCGTSGSQSTQMIQDYQNRLLLISDDTISMVGEEKRLNAKLWSESTLDTVTTIPAGGLLWRSKEMDFGNLGAKKTIRKIYFTYTLGGNIFESSGVYMFLLADGKVWNIATNIINQNHTPIIGESSDKNLDAQLYNGTLNISDPSAIVGSYGFNKTAGVPRTVALTFQNTVYNGSSESLKDMMKKINSLQIVLYNPSTAVSKSQFSIDDITIIYKEHSIK